MHYKNIQDEILVKIVEAKVENRKPKYLIIDIDTLFDLRESLEFTHYTAEVDEKSKVYGLIICIVDGTEKYLEVA